MNPLPDDASKDQYGEIPQGYYRRNTGMLHMLPTAPQSPANASLSDEELQDKAYLREIAMRELVDIVRDNKGRIQGIGAVKELLDRSEGRTTQVIHQVNENISKTSACDLTNEQLVIELRRLADAGSLPDGVMLLEDGTVTIDN